MISVYKIKPKFQKLLQPILFLLRKIGVSPNQITIFTVFFSIAIGVFLFFGIENKLLFLFVSFCNWILVYCLRFFPKVSAKGSCCGLLQAPARLLFTFRRGPRANTPPSTRPAHAVAHAREICVRIRTGYPVKPDLSLLGKRFTIVHDDEEVVASISGFSVGRSSIDLPRIYRPEFSSWSFEVWKPSSPNLGSQIWRWGAYMDNDRGKHFYIDRGSESLQHTRSSGSTPTTSKLKEWQHRT